MALHVTESYKNLYRKMNRPKVLLLQEDITNYRIPIYNLIGKEVDLTVAYTNTYAPHENINFSVLNLIVKRIGPIKYTPELSKIRKNYDVIIIIPHLKCINFWLLAFFKNGQKIISWSNGSRASYTTPFDFNRKIELTDILYWNILKKCHANILYIKEAIPWLVKHGIKKETLFIANNTTDVYRNTAQYNRNIFLFVGTLYKKKGLDILLSSYSKLIRESTNIEIIPKLVIIGKGEEREELEQYVIENGIKDKVIFTGAIYDEKILSDYFAKAIMCISPNQAGLSVLKSFGYGVPFITNKKAITGGEIVNIKHEYNGILMNDSSELYNILLESVNNPMKFLKMGENAKKYYEEYATPQKMAQGVLNGIYYALDLKN